MTYQVGDMVQLIHAHASWYGLVIELNKDIATVWRPTKSEPGRIQTWKVATRRCTQLEKIK